VTTTEQDGASVRLAPPAPSRAAVCMWCAGPGRRRPFPHANTSYMRPAKWPPSMHKCARDPALPLALCSRPLCTRVQRWDPTLPRAPEPSSGVHRCAATGAHAVGQRCAQGASMERVARQSVSHGHKGRMRDCQERRGAEPLFSWPGCRGSAPLGVQGAKPPPHQMGQSPQRGAGAAPRRRCSGQSPHRGCRGRAPPVTALHPTLTR
jgi:hypothetical protein